MSLLRRFSLLVCLCLAASLALSQETPSVQVDVREVTLPVTVRDKHGKLVSTLQQVDFTLAQDGKAQAIKSLRRDSNLPLTLGLLVDTSFSMREQLSAEKAASQKFLDEMLAQSKDQAFLIHFDRQVELLQDLTSSKDKLYKGLGLLETSSSNTEDQQTGDDKGEPRMRRRSGTQLYDALYLAATEVLKKQEGRKAIVILTDGQDRGSKETLADAVEASQRADTIIYAIFFKGEEGQRRRFSNGGGMGGPRIGFPGGGGGYPGGGYPGGQRRGGEPREARVDGKKILAEITAKTGGRVFEATKKDGIDAIYTEIAEELRSQYVLAYAPDKTSADPGFHRVTLSAKDKDLLVTTREGFYIPEATTAAAK